MLKRSTALLVLALALPFAAPAWASDSTSPVGTWTTIDDTTQKPKSVVEISESNGELSGKVLQVLQSDQGPHPLCTKCTGDLKDKRIEGLQIISGLKKEGDAWQGGKILDPKSGKVYDCKIHLTDGGQKLEVRGFKGISLLGRTQVWERKSTP